MRTVRWILKKVLQLLLLTACGIAVAYGVMLKADFGNSHWLPSAVWVSLLVFTVITFSAVVVEFRRQRNVVDWLAGIVARFLRGGGASTPG
jgi:integral membrane sensor domain MASE1